MSRNDPVELTLAVHHETNAALLVSETAERDPETGRVKDGRWLPLKEITFDDAGEEEKLDRWRASPQRGRGHVIITLQAPEWLARDRGLI